MQDIKKNSLILIPIPDNQVNVTIELAQSACVAHDKTLFYYPFVYKARTARHIRIFYYFIT